VGKERGVTPNVGKYSLHKEKKIMDGEW
jgi:hypothetical protein